MKHLSYFFKTICLIFLVSTFTSCDKDNEELKEDKQLVADLDSCTDAEVKEHFSSCIWNMNSDTHDFLNELRIDFSNENIHVYDANDTVVDEGYWEIKDGTLTFHNLSMALANYVGEWSINECRDDFLSISRGEETIHLEKVCEEK